MPEPSENQLVVLTGKPPRTVRKRLDKLEFKRGKSRAKLYDSSVALVLILGAGDGESLIEAQRRLANARAEGLREAFEQIESRDEKAISNQIDEVLAVARGEALRRIHSTL